VKRAIEPNLIAYVAGATLEDVPKRDAEMGPTYAIFFPLDVVSDPKVILYMVTRGVQSPLTTISLVIVYSI